MSELIHVEQVESRRLFAQAVYPQNPVDLSGNNTITITQLSNSGFTVRAYVGGSLIDSETFGPSTSLKIDAGGGDDLVETASGFQVTLPEFLIGNTGNDTLVGDLGNDTLDGSSGNDILLLSGGNDVLGGSAGTDTVSGENIASSSTVMYYKIDGTGTANDYLISGGSIIKTDNIDCENLVGGPGNDELSGSGSANFLDGGSAGADTLYGGSGNDTLYGESGNDFLSGGPDTDKMYGFAGNDTLEGGSGANDYLQGDDGNDSFNLADSVGNTDRGVGGVGTDVLTASDSDDIFTQ